MKRKETNKRPLAIFTADWHLREDQPVCRTDDFQKEQWNKIQFIKDLQNKYDCLVLHAGDLFHHWKPSPYLLSKTIEHLPNNFWTVAGNHDLPQHNMELIEKSGIFTLIKAGKINLLSGCHWGGVPDIPRSLAFPTTEETVLVWHVMTWKGNTPYPNCPDPDCFRLLRKYKEFDVLLTGHNHQSFTAEQDGRLLVNPGCITRQEADQTNHKPCIYLWYGETDIQQIFLPHNRGVISREHIELQQKKTDRIDAFITRLNSEWESTISFEDNLERFFASNDIETDVKDIIYKSIEEQ